MFSFDYYQNIFQFSCFKLGSWAQVSFRWFSIQVCVGTGGMVLETENETDSERNRKDERRVHLQRRLSGKNSRISKVRLNLYDETKKRRQEDTDTDTRSLSVGVPRRYF